MRKQSVWKTIYWCLVILQFTALGVSAVAAGFKNLDAESIRKKTNDFIADNVLSIQESVVWLVPVAAGLIVVFEQLKKWVGTPWVWDSIQKLLDAFREEAFIHKPQEKHIYQVTLYQKVTYLWNKRWWKWWKSTHAHNSHPLGTSRSWKDGWLVPVARAGKYGNQKTNTVFLCPDDVVSAEGIPGVVWANRIVWPIVDLPYVDPAKTDDQVSVELQEYATKAGVSIEWLKARRKDRKHLPRTMCGVPIAVNHESWGVLMLDSTDPKGLASVESGWPPYKLIPLMLNEVLKRA